MKSFELDIEITEIKAIILDFDQTITFKHTSGRAWKKDLNQEKILSNIKPFFSEFIHLIEKKEIKFFIATYGDDSFAHGNPEILAGHDLVKRYMDECFSPGQNLFKEPNRQKGKISSYENIIAAFSRDQKSFHMDIIEKKLKKVGIKNSECLFVDDDEANLQLACQRDFQLLIRKQSKSSAKLSISEDLFFDLIKKFHP